jgi:hypothetical protein
VTVKNLAASVQARLQNHARATKRPFQELLQYYAMERFLYRLSKTPYRAHLVLKGALMLHVWEAPLARATKDSTSSAASTTRSCRSTWGSATSSRRARSPSPGIPGEALGVVTFLAEFLLPIARALASGESFDRHWSPGGPWRT